MSWLDGISEEEWSASAIRPRRKHFNPRPDPSRDAILAHMEAKYEEDMSNYKPLERKTTDYRGISEELLRMLEYKGSDYGSDQDPLDNIRSAADYGIKPWVSALVRAGDKMNRLKNAAAGKEMYYDTTEDNLMDLANYAIIALRLLREERFAEPEGDLVVLVTDFPLTQW